MELYLGIDQSYRSTACVISDENGNVVFHTIIKKQDEDDIYFASWRISNEICKIEKQYKPTSIAIEGLSFGLRGNVTRDLAGLQFTIINRLRFQNFIKNIQIVPPLTLKKFATDRGHAKKEEMINALPPEVLAVFVNSGAKKTKGLTDLADAYFLSRYVKVY